MLEWLSARSLYWRETRLPTVPPQHDKHQFCPLGKKHRFFFKEGAFEVHLWPYVLLQRRNCDAVDARDKNDFNDNIGVIADRRSPILSN
jgi:hypothetical protein